jgi:hypothetical protein
MSLKHSHIQNDNIRPIVLISSRNDKTRNESNLHYVPIRISNYIYVVAPNGLGRNHSFNPSALKKMQLPPCHNAGTAVTGISLKRLVFSRKIEMFAITIQ